MEPEIVADYACVTGEGPLWHPQEQRLYWVDIPQCRLFRFDPATGHHEQCFQGDPGDQLGGFTFQADGSLLLFMARGAVRRWREGDVTTLIEEIPEDADSRFNDVAADPEGRVFCGTMPTEKHTSRLYRLDTNGTLTRVLDDVGLSNGMGFTLDEQQMYYTDTRRKTIYRFDYDRQSGALSNQHVFVYSGSEDGSPDGMTVDAEGFVWSARWDGSCLVRYAPDGREDRRIHFPAKKVSSAAFGGPSYEDLYVTTAGGQNKVVEGAGAGALFRLRPGVRGAPRPYSRIRL